MSERAAPRRSAPGGRRPAFGVSPAAMLVTLLAACSPMPEPQPLPLPADATAITPATSSGQDTTGLVPAGYGSLRQDDIALRLEVDGAQVKLIPLDESVIRLLSPDSYRALHELVASRAAEITRLSTVHGLRERNVWLVSFYGLTPEARFSPLDLSVRTPGREVRPVAVLPLTTGFGEHRVRARETQSALFLLEDGLDLAQPITVAMGLSTNAEWADVIRLLERERALVRSRIGR